MKMILKKLIYWKYQDFKKHRKDLKDGVVNFKPFGLRLYCGSQGSGKTIGMVEQLDTYRLEYPDALIVTNFEYQFADKRMNSLVDLLKIRNGQKGVIFAIDEIQNEFSSNASRNFPETLLSVITMQRKQRINILATAQVFTRVAKPLREQTFEVVDCRTIWGRWTRLKCYSADDYNTTLEKVDKIEAKMKIRKKWKHSFVQTDDLRNHYDTYSVVERLSRDGFKEKIDLDI